MNAVPDLPDALLKAKRYAGKTNGAAVPEAKLKTAAAFCAEYVPLIRPA